MGDLAERHNGVLISPRTTAKPSLCPVEPAGPRPHVRRARRRRVRRHDHRHPHRDNDLVVNPIKGKQLTNVRAWHRRSRAPDQPIQLTSNPPSNSLPTTRSSKSPQEHPPAQALLKEHDRKRAARDEA